MVELQTYHDVGGIELIVTSTLAAEVDIDSSQANKAKSYQKIGGVTYMIQGVPGMQSMHGATLRPSQMHLLRTRLFAHSSTGHTFTRAIRDYLHIDQAQMNAADIFVTSDRRLHRAQEILKEVFVPLAVASPEAAVTLVKKHLVTSLGTSHLSEVAKLAAALGPIVLGSNSFQNCAVFYSTAGESMLALRIEDGLLKIEGNLRDERGRVAVTLHGGQAARIESPRASLTQVGKGPLLVSSEPFGSFVIDVDGSPVLAIRTNHTNRAVVFAMRLRDESGRVVASIERESLVLQGSGVQVG